MYTQTHIQHALSLTHTYIYICIHKHTYNTHSRTHTHTTRTHTHKQAKEIPDGAYSIEEAKLKRGEDAKRVAADELKEKVRQSIRLLRRDYREAVKLNEALPSEVRVRGENRV